MKKILATLLFAVGAVLLVIEAGTGDNLALFVPGAVAIIATVGVTVTMAESQLERRFLSALFVCTVAVFAISGFLEFK